jgi:hypothetical protein
VILAIAVDMSRYNNLQLALHVPGHVDFAVGLGVSG